MMVQTNGQFFSMSPNMIVQKYMLQNEDEVTLTKNGKPCLFYASELMQYHGEGGEPSVSMEQALVLNGVELSRTDVEYRECLRQKALSWQHRVNVGYMWGHQRPYIFIFCSIVS
jgi:hypothetical protein